MVCKPCTVCACKKAASRAAWHAAAGSTSTTLPASASKDDIEQTALASEAFLRHSSGGAIKKVVVVPGRLVNVVVG